MKKKRIILLSVAAVVVLVGVGFGIYLWPQRIERNFKDVSLWYADIIQTEENDEGFRANAADVTLSLTKRRHLTAPDQYTGTITINDKTYTVYGRIYSGSFFDVFKEKFQEKLAENKRNTIYLSARTIQMKEIASDVNVPASAAVATLIMSGDLERFYLSESLSLAEDASGKQTRYYIYPAENEEEALAVYDSLEGMD